MKIYFMGICGTAMGNAALLARAAGHEVLGSDLGVYPPMSTVLAAAGIEIHVGYDPERLERLHKAFRLLLAAKMNTTQALEKIKQVEGEDAAILAAFIERSQRGVIK